MDFSKHLIASATGEGGVKFRIQKDIKREAFFINAGSKAIKTYKAHPNKPGVSIVHIASNKIIVVLGNLIRVYSFDFKNKH